MAAELTQDAGNGQDGWNRCKSIVEAVEQTEEGHAAKDV
jgi:hypothetical protein